jgi:tRNA threonylcarbamoyladenosine biosynthesis protein TsaB
MLLAIDSASRKIGIALYDGVEVLHEAIWHSHSHHTVELTPAIAFALEQRGNTIEDIQVIAISIGPGSYTGLPFDIIAAAQPVQKDIQLAVVLEAGRGRLAIGWYKPKDDTWQSTNKSALFTPEKFNKRIRKPTLICGELSGEVRKLLGRKRKNAVLASPAQSLRRPSFLAELAWERWQAGEVDDPAEIAPFYLQTGENIPA